MVKQHIFYPLYHYRILHIVIKNELAVIICCFTLSWLLVSKFCNLTVGLTISSAILVSYCCIIDYHKLRGLKQHSLLPHFLCVRRPSMAQLDTQFRIFQNHNQGVRLHPFWILGLLSSLHDCWQNLAPGSWSTEVPILFLAINKIIKCKISTQKCMPSV